MSFGEYCFGSITRFRASHGLYGSNPVVPAKSAYRKLTTTGFSLRLIPGTKLLCNLQADMASVSIAAESGISSSKHSKCFLPSSSEAAVESMLTQLFLKRSAAEQVHQLDHKNDDNCQLQEECSALVELVHHETIQFLGGAHFPGHKILVVGHTYLQSR